MRLQLTRRTDYAIGAAVLLAASPACPVPSRRIAERMGIPGAFLPQVLADLQRAGLVESRSGKSGGYCLARRPAAITILELIEAVEGPLAGGRPAGVEPTVAVLDPLWDEARGAYSDVLANTTLAQAARRWAEAEPQRSEPSRPLDGPTGPERIPA